MNNEATFSRDAMKLPGLDPSFKPPRDGPVIGIDLGTTNSCVAIVENGRPRVVRSREGYGNIPSIVALSDRGRLMVGHPAKGQMVTNPSQTVYGSKRLVGRPYDSSVVTDVKARMFYEIVEGPDGAAAVRLGDTDLTLEEISALLLNEARELASIELGRPIHRAVVTCPAFYQENQRQAVRRAGKLAGLIVERVVNEPTAAALAFGHGKALKKKFAVYDLGGGTFDATLLKVSGDTYEVMATGGDTFLGGVDFDHELVDHILVAFNERNKTPLRVGPAVLQRVAAAAEAAKLELSSTTSHRVHVPFAMLKDDVPYDIDVTITREKLEELVTPFVDKTIAVFDEVFRSASLAQSDVDEVILVGGMTRMPLVQRKLEAYFGKAAQKGVHPDECVALGAAILADAVFRGDDTVTLVDVLPMSIGVLLPAGRFKPILAKNTPLPVRKTYSINTTKKNQKSLELKIYQGENETAELNELLGRLVLDGLPPGPKGSVEIEVSFSLSRECLLSLSAKERKSGRHVEATLATKGTPIALRQRATRPLGTRAAPKGIWGKVMAFLGR